MTGSYMVILTAFLADNGKNLPLATGARRRLLAAVGRYRGTADRLVPAPPPGPEPAAGPAPAAGTADPLGLRDARQRHRADRQLAPGLHPDGTL